MPLDLRALRSPVALDVYAWLPYRNATLRRPTRIPWRLLARQLGAAYRTPRDFRRAFLRALRRVLAVYPEARVRPVRAGLLLQPSPTHVPRRDALR